MAEREKLNGAAWYAANKVRRNKTIATWQAANADKSRLAHAAWYVINSKTAKETHAAWRSANPEKCRIYGHTRRARKLGVVGKLSHGLAGRLFVSQMGMCPCCDQPLGDKFEMDHIMPLFLQGTNTDDNIQLLRRSCNRQKHAKHPDVFMQQRGRSL